MEIYYIMKIELLIIGITLFLAIDTYYDGKYSSYLSSGRKYFKIATISFIGLSLITFIKKHPTESKGLLSHASNIVKYMPIDKNAEDLLTPIFDFTSLKNPMTNLTPQTKRMMRSGLNSNKRCVSETKKKFVASQQNWKCGKCNAQLAATFEVDHKLDLQFGGTNHVNNLVALCRNCHGEKGMMHKL